MHKDYIAIPFSFISVKKKKVLVVAIFKADNGSDFYFVCSEDGEPFVVASVASRISISPSYASLDVSAEQRVNGHKATLAWSAARVKEFETKRPSYLMRQYTSTGKALVEACEEKGPAAASKIKAPNEADPPAAKRSAAPAELLVLPTTWSQIKKTDAPEVRRCPRSFKGQKAVRRLAGHPDGSQEDACRQAQDRAGGVPRQFQRNEPAFKPIDLATGGAAEQPQESQESQQRIQELERELALMKQMQALSQTQVPPVQPIRTQVLPTQLAAPVLPPQSTALPEDDDAEPRLHRYESGCIVVQGGVTLNLSLGAPCGTAAGAPAAGAPQPPVRVPISTQTLPNAATNPIGLLAPLRSFSKAEKCKRAQAQRIIESTSTNVLGRAAAMAP